MLIFLNTDKSFNELISKEKYPKRYINIEMDTYITMAEYTDMVYNSLQMLRERGVLTFTSLTECLMNTETNTNKFDILYRQFRGILETAVIQGHEVLIFTDRYDMNPYINELDNKDGVSVINNIESILGKIEQGYL